jgi:hypothetical protein
MHDLRLPRTRWLTVCLARLAVALLAGAAHAQDAGLVTQLKGPASYVATGAKPAGVINLMKIRSGDVISVPAGGALKLLYFKSAAVETWTGPARMTVGEDHSEQGSGQMIASSLPAVAHVTIELNRINNINRIGAVVVRGITPPDVDIKQARERYDAWRAATTPDDLLPDFYLYSVYKQYKRTAEMQALVADMQKRVPDSEEAKALALQSGSAPTQ